MSLSIIASFVTMIAKLLNVVGINIASILFNWLGSFQGSGHELTEEAPDTHVIRFFKNGVDQGIAFKVSCKDDKCL